jgi:methionyl-tRNA formyltransferase
MLLIERLPIASGDTTGSLHDKLAELGGRMIVEAIELAGCGGLRPVPQPPDGVTYARKIDKGEAAIVWTEPAPTIERRVRAFDPFPGATATMRGESIKVWRARVEATASARAPGTVLDVNEHGILVACGSGALRLAQLQRAGGKRIAAADFVRGFAVAPGALFETAA